MGYEFHDDTNPAIGFVPAFRTDKEWLILPLREPGDGLKFAAVVDASRCDWLSNMFHGSDGTSVCTLRALFAVHCAKSTGSDRLEPASPGATFYSFLTPSIVSMRRISIPGVLGQYRVDAGVIDEVGFGGFH
jgi:hypothetical protein